MGVSEGAPVLTGPGVPALAGTAPVATPFGTSCAPPTVLSGEGTFPLTGVTVALDELPVVPVPQPVIAPAASTMSSKATINGFLLVKTKTICSFQDKKNRRNRWSRPGGLGTSRLFYHTAAALIKLIKAGPAICVAFDQ